jgi:hypothetical protein
MGRHWPGVAVGVGVCLALLSAPALAFDIAPPSATVQGGQSVTASLTGLPVAQDGGPTCVEVAGGAPSTSISITFNPVCGQTAGWSSTMSILTIPATPAGAYQFVVQVCVAPGCTLRTSGGGNIGNTTPLQTQIWQLNVTPGLPVQSPTPSPPPSPVPSPSPVPVVTTPPVVVTRSPVPTRTAPASPVAPVPAVRPSTAPSASPTPSPSPSLPVPQISLNQGSVNAGGTVTVAGSGCGSDALVGLDAASAVTATALADSGGRFQGDLRLPASLAPGTYEVVATCGGTADATVNVTAPAGKGLEVTVVILVLAVVAFGLGLVGQRYFRERRGL